MTHSSAAASGSSPHPPVGERESLRPAGVALAGLSTVFLFEMLDNSILNVALPTIGRELHASTTGLQWVTGAYAVVFGGLMLFFGALADRAGRRRVMLIGLALLGLASLATAFVTTAEELIAVRAVMGVAAAMTTPGSLALAFRLFRSDDARVRATTLISTVGLVGLAIGPAVGGLVLSWAPWQVLLLVNVPIALLAGIGIRVGIPADDPADLHRVPLDVAGALTGTVAVVLLLAAPTMFVQDAVGAPLPWVLLAVAAGAVVLFVVRARRVAHPILDLRLVTLPLVSSGLLYKAATGLATAGLGFSVTLQLQSDWGWSPFWAAIGMLPQVVVLLAGGLFVGPLVRRLGLDRVAWLSAGAVVVGLGIFSAFGRGGVPVGRGGARPRGVRHPSERRRRRDQRHEGDAEQPHHHRRRPRGHRHRGRDRRRCRRHRHGPGRHVHRECHGRRLDARAGRPVRSGDHDRWPRLGPRRCGAGRVGVPAIPGRRFLRHNAGARLGVRDVASRPEAVTRLATRPAPPHALPRRCSLNCLRPALRRGRDGPPVASVLPKGPE